MSHLDHARATRAARAENRARIEAAAARLFGERGYAATTIDDIAAAAGLSKPMLYRHFDSKKELHLELLERQRDVLTAAPPGKPLSGDGDPDSRLRAVLEAWFEQIESSPYTWRLLSAGTTGDPEVRQLHRDIQARQREAATALLRQYAPRLPDAELEPLGEALRSALHGLALWWPEHRDTPRSVLVSAMLRIVRGLVAPAGGRPATDRDRDGAPAR
ncbi:TetR/AcrR family transcriptional regulator [Streptomyces sp. NPDC008001]|uniref:TetR/AcrR family transcriptional regulator n=1 Tax=Streptomyces sp. NPDC008001 TaxID=3364804 RepID=UPI0036E05A18